MLVDQRRGSILQLVEVKGFVPLQELADHVQASESTVRRDLEYLDGIGQIRRTRGGAAFIGESITPFDERSTSARKEKERIAAVAADLIQPGEAILLDGGTTTLELARRLAGKSLQVVTNSLPIANVLASQPGIELLMVGGYVYPKTGVALGPVAEAALEAMHVRRLFMSVGGITEAGLFNSNSLLVATERRMIAAADEFIVLSDSSKFGRSALAHLCGLDEVDRIVVDAGVPDEWRAIAARHQVELVIAETPSSNGVPNG